MNRIRNRKDLCCICFPLAHGAMLIGFLNVVSFAQVVLASLLHPGIARYLALPIVYYGASSIGFIRHARKG